VKYLVVLAVILNNSSFAQADINMGWNISLTEGGRIGVYNPVKEGGYIAGFKLTFNNKTYEHEYKVTSSEWGFVDFGYTTEDIPERTGASQMPLEITVQSEAIYDEQVYFSARNNNQAYDIRWIEIVNGIDYRGNTFSDCIFWNDAKGYNYILRSYFSDTSSIYVCHYLKNISENIILLSAYESSPFCENTENLIQEHSIGWNLIDADNDGYMEFHTMVISDCKENKERPKTAELIVFEGEDEHVFSGQMFNLDNSLEY